MTAELNHPFAPTPLGSDLYSNFLDEFATPIVGNFDPPLAFSSATVASDHTAPTSSVSALAATTNSASFTVNWSGQDDAGGSGIANYDVYVSDNGGNFTRWLNHTASTSATYNGVNGHTYAFMSVATDNGGNLQATPTAAQATTKVQVQTSVSTTTSLTATASSIVAGQSVTFTARVTGGTPTGTITFKDGATTLATVTLVSGAATYSNTTFAASYPVPISTPSTTTSSRIWKRVGHVGRGRRQSTTPPPPPPSQGQTFNGTAANDIFTITPANATGSITVTISNASTGNVARSLGTIAPTGTIFINGLGGNDTLKLATATIGGRVVTITQAFSFSGGDGLDTLVGANQANIWNITGLNSGTLNNGSFDTVENLTGGTATDAFKFGAAGSLGGKVAGGLGANSLDYSAYGKPAVVNLQTSTASGAAGFATIQSIVGSSGSTLVGLNTNSAWNITGSGSGNVSSITFSGMTNLTGGSGADTFTLANGAGVSGKIDGGVGTDTLNTSTTSVTVNLFTASATGAASIANFESFSGSTNTSDTLIGPNAANTWTVSTANSGKLNATMFAGFENLTGGSLNDNFVLGKSVGVAGHIDGGAGINMLDYAAYTTAVAVNLNTGTATGVGRGVNNIRVVRGGSAADTITGDGNNDALIGGAGNDILTAGSGHNLLFGGLGADTINGGSGENIMFNGTTNFDANIATIDNLLAYWSRTDIDYNTRVAALRAGTAVGSPKLNSTTVLNDTSVNTLNGGSGLDWYFAKLAGTTKDTITNQVTGEQVN